MFPTRRLALALLLLATPLWAQVVRLDLAGLVRRTDDAVYGEVVARRVFRVLDEGGEPLYFTELTLEGRSIDDGRSIVVDVVYPGGVLEDGEGVWNSEAPEPADTAEGERVVVFYRWCDDLGGGVAGNVPYALHGGVYRTVKGPKGPVVLGRGEGYAVRDNVLVDHLDAAVTAVGR